MDALTQTKRYVFSLNQGHHDSLEIENRLAELWLRAGGKVYEIDNDMAERCMFKAYGWYNEWKAIACNKDPDVMSARINLDQIVPSISGIGNS